MATSADAVTQSVPSPPTSVIDAISASSPAVKNSTVGMSDKGFRIVRSECKLFSSQVQKFYSGESQSEEKILKKWRANVDISASGDMPLGSVSAGLSGKHSSQETSAHATLSRDVHVWIAEVIGQTPTGLRVTPDNVDPEFRKTVESLPNTAECLEQETLNPAYEEFFRDIGTRVIVKQMLGGKGSFQRNEHQGTNESLSAFAVSTKAKVKHLLSVGGTVGAAWEQAQGDESTMVVVHQTGGAGKSVTHLDEFVHNCRLEPAPLWSYSLPISEFVVWDNRRQMILLHQLDLFLRPQPPALGQCRQYIRDSVQSGCCGGKPLSDDLSTCLSLLQSSKIHEQARTLICHFLAHEFSGPGGETKCRQVLEKNECQALDSMCALLMNLEWRPHLMPVIHALFLPFSGEGKPRLKLHEKCSELAASACKACAPSDDNMSWRVVRCMALAKLDLRGSAGFLHSQWVRCADYVIESSNDRVLKYKQAVYLVKYAAEVEDLEFSRHAAPRIVRFMRYFGHHLGIIEFCCMALRLARNFDTAEAVNAALATLQASSTVVDNHRACWCLLEQQVDAVQLPTTTLKGLILQSVKFFADVRLLAAVLSIYFKLFCTSTRGQLVHDDAALQVQLERAIRNVWVQNPGCKFELSSQPSMDKTFIRNELRRIAENSVAGPVVPITRIESIRPAGTASGLPQYLRSVDAHTDLQYAVVQQKADQVITCLITASEDDRRVALLLSLKHRVRFDIVQLLLPPQVQAFAGGYTLLHVACLYGAGEVVVHLLSLGTYDIEAVNEVPGWLKADVVVHRDACSFGCNSWSRRCVGDVT
eukprot:TRINITY_DN1354_c0_g1_i2.p1 TRINITY_DN1354_c0_g1~~TRINITY_DN1354_c0_g1_i2.p1  ORF type:complete len:826 (+),score=88.11 TRINITY_DN1354_c0_g1_i2:33-2480(+)